MAGGEGALAQHTHDDAAVGHAGGLGDVHPDHILEQLEQRLRAAGVELLRGLCALRHKAGARGDPLLEVLVLHQLLDGMVLKDAETGLPQVMHRELVGRIGEQDVGRLHGTHERGREDGIHLRILEPLFQLGQLGAALVTQGDVRAAADVKAL